MSECMCDSGSQQRAGSARDSRILCEGVQGKSPAAASIPLALLLAAPCPCQLSVVSALGHQHGSPYPLPADSPFPVGCPIVLPMLRLAEDDSQGKRSSV